MTLLKQKFVDDLHWLDEEEMLDLVAIAQSSPGAIAVNGAIIVGYKLCGIPGIILSVLGAIIPPFIILTVISFFYNAFKRMFFALCKRHPFYFEYIVAGAWKLYLKF